MSSGYRGDTSSPEGVLCLTVKRQNMMFLLLIFLDNEEDLLGSPNLENWIILPQVVHIQN